MRMSWSTSACVHILSSLPTSLMCKTFMYMCVDACVGVWVRACVRACARAFVHWCVLQLLHVLHACALEAAVQWKDRARHNVPRRVYRLARAPCPTKACQHHDVIGMCNRTSAYSVRGSLLPNRGDPGQRTSSVS